MKETIEHDKTKRVFEQLKDLDEMRFKKTRKNSKNHTMQKTHQVPASLNIKDALITKSEPGN